MEYRTLGKSDMRVSVISQGSWAIGGPWAHGWGEVDDQESIRTIRKSIDAGINFIDSANVYGLGHAEEIIGKAIQGKRDKVFLATKFGAIPNANAPGGFNWDGSPEHMARECEKSLKRLKTDRLDMLQVHWPIAETPIADTMEGFRRLIQQGKLRYAGVCNFSKVQLEEALKYGNLVSLQLRYNLLERDMEEEVIPFCFANGIGVQVYGPLAHGLLAGEFKHGDKLKAEDWRSRYTLYEPATFEKIMGVLDKLLPIAKSHNHTLADLAINWILNRRGVTTALIGMMHPWQVDENLRSIDFTLSQKDLAEIDRTIKEADIGLRILAPEAYMEKTKQK
jgi:aryl-alcohol dehydrogenase-like predicted oxidoreductase